MTAEDPPGTTRRELMAGGLVAATAGATAGCPDRIESTPTERASGSSNVEPLAYVPKPYLQGLLDELYFLVRSEPATLAELDIETDASDFGWIGKTAQYHFDRTRISPMEVETLVTGAPTADWTSSDGNINIFTGTFDTEIVRHQLWDLDYEPVGTYEGVELLSDPDGTDAAAFDDDTLLLAKDGLDPLPVLRSALDARASDGRERIVEANDGVELLFDRVDGEYIDMKLLLRGHHARRKHSIAVTGNAYEFDTETVDLTSAIVFTSEDAAEAARDDGWVQESIEDLDWRNVELEWESPAGFVTADRPLEGFER